MLEISPPGFFAMMVVLRCGLLVSCLWCSLRAQAAENCQTFDYSLEQISQLRLNQFPSDIYTPWAGKTLRHIIIEAGNVFNPANPDENNWLYRHLDALHINTRPNVIKSQLLFKEGEPLDVEKVRSSARLLRTRSYLASAYIVPVLTCDDWIDLRVVTRDSWSTEPDTTLSHSGGQTKSGMGLSENNLLGTGTRVALNYEQLPERNSIGYEIFSPHIWNSRYAAYLSYADKSDGVDKIASLSRPFASLDTPWAFGISSKDITQTDYITSYHANLDEFGHEITRNDMFIGQAFSITPQATQRVLAGISQADDQFSRNQNTRMALPSDRRNTYPWLAYRFIDNEFGVFKNVRQIQQLEDIATGRDFYLRLGYSGDDWGNAQDTLFLQSQFNDVIGVSEHHLIEVASGLDARWITESHGEITSFGYAALAYNYFIDDRARWYLAARYDQGRNLAPYEELSLGGAEGLRGYPADFQRGDHKIVVKLERRYFGESHLFNVLRFGAVAFAETGRAWGSAFPQNEAQVSDIGIGLRISSSKAHIGNVVHLDLAMPLAERDKVDEVQWIISTQQQF